MVKTIMAKTMAKSNGKPASSAGAETVAQILERERDALIHEWLGLVEKQAPISVAASHHGDLRRKQGYTVAMVVEESRLLQVCLFTTLHKNTKQLDYEKLLPDVVTIADEVDAQLKQQMLRYMAANAVVSKPKLH
jgi:hypothetical protein